MTGALTGALTGAGTGTAIEVGRAGNGGSAPVVYAEAVSVSFGSTQVLREVSLTLAPGEVVAVMGPSGSGKSTLLHTLTGLIRPDSGRVGLDGVDLAGLSDRQRSRLRLERIGFVAQFGDLVPELTLRENVELPLRLLGRGRAESRSRAGLLLDRLGIGDSADRRAGDVSGGQVQRAAVARALAHSPAVVLADEPTGSLDTVSGEQVLDALLEAAADHGSAVLLVTHEARVAAHADREAILRDGVLRDGVLRDGVLRDGVLRDGGLREGDAGPGSVGA